MRLLAFAATCGIALMSITAGDASAQPDVSAPPSGRAPRLEVSVLGVFANGAELADSSATLLGNAVPSGTPSALFTAQTRIASTPSGEVRVGVRMGARWVAEGGVGYGRPELRVRLANDIEGAPDVTASSRLTQLVLDGALVYRWRAGRTSPFVMAGGGYLRQLDEPRTTVGTGQVYFGGGGLLYGLGPARDDGGHRFRLRGDIRVMAYRGGLLISKERPAGIVAGAGLTIALW